MPRQPAKVRVVSGRLRGRVIKTPPAHDLSVRPTRSQVRESLFNSLGEEINGATVLDLFGGSGALSWEAISRGADFAWIVEKNVRHLRLLRENAQALDLESSTEIVHADARKLDMARFRGTSFKFVFADPPYEFWKSGPSRSEILQIFQRLDREGVLSEYATIFCESDHSLEPELSACEGFASVAHKRIGRTEIVVLEKTSHHS